MKILFFLSYRMIHGGCQLRSTASSTTPSSSSSPIFPLLSPFLQCWNWIWILSRLYASKIEERIRNFPQIQIRLSWEKNRIRLYLNSKNKNLYIRKLGIIFFFIYHHFKLEFVDSGLYFVQDENKFIYPLLQIGSGFGEKVLDPAGQKSTDPTGSGFSSPA